MTRIVHALVKKAFTPVTIMLIPHGNLNALNLRIPVVGLVVCLLMAMVGGGYIVRLAISSLEYRHEHQTMADKVKFYSERFSQWNSTMTALRKVESEFRKIFSLESKEDILRTVDVDNLFIGSIDSPDLEHELKKTIATVGEIKEYLAVQKDIFTATPLGYPADGNISSGYGKRTDPITGLMAFHSGIDISCGRGSDIRATADGVVSHSGWANQSGYVVVIEHGCGFSTVYAHNKSNAVKVGQTIKRGDIIGYVGSTGRSTGPHVHYEVWKDGKSINPYEYLKRRS